jgi:hypothetical protein
VQSPNAIQPGWSGLGKRAFNAVVFGFRFSVFGSKAESVRAEPCSELRFGRCEPRLSPTATENRKPKTENWHLGRRESPERKKTSRPSQTSPRSPRFPAWTLRLLPHLPRLPP